MSEYDLRENMQSRIFSLCVPLFLKREMVESLYVAIFCYEIRVTRGNVWKNTSTFTFSPRLRVLAGVQTVWQENILFCRIWHTSVRVLTLITNLTTHFSEFMTSKSETFMLNYLTSDQRVDGWGIGVWFPLGEETSHVRGFYTGCRSHTASYLMLPVEFTQWWSGRDVMLATNMHYIIVLNKGNFTFLLTIF
jgi:hypothetical protein